MVSAMLLSCFGCGSDDPTEGTSVASGQAQNTDPSEGTEPSDPIQPSEGTEPSEGTQPTEPPVTNPPVTNPPVTEPPVTNPPVTNPPETEPPVVIQPTTYPTEPEDNGYKGVTPDNLSEETVAGWTADDYNQFEWKYWDEMTNQEKHDLSVLRQNNGVYYRCGTSGHHCMTPTEHERRGAFICTYCGQNNCAGWGLRDETMDAYNYLNCPEYNVFKDPQEYCQTCGKRCFIIGVTSILEGCQHGVMDGNCCFCGEYSKAYECHTCKEENLYPDCKKYIIP